ncbi:MAG: hypothetical protein HY820_27855 [Acidobacteria bacterium]|nr:hypothetical protein [Acidobacteriota bacterium]
MTTTMLEVSGLYEHSGDGEKVAQTLRERGYGPVTVFPLTKERISRLPAGDQETARRMVGGVLAAPIGFVAAAVAVAVPAALVGGPLLAAPVALLFGVMGAVAGLVFANRTPKRYRHYQEEGGVIVTAACVEGGREEVVKAFHESQAVEVDITTAGG